MSKKTEAEPGKRTIIGKIAGAHGVNGTMLILPLTDYPERFLKMKEIVLSKPGKPGQTLMVRKLVPYEGKVTFFLNAEGINDRETAESFKGSIITVPDKERIELPEDEYWIDDMIGLKAVDNSTGSELGVVDEVIFTGSNDVYLIKTPEGVLKPIPALADAINKVDIAAGILRVTIPEGLWD
mgnify:CR=1 FL=1